MKLKARLLSKLKSTAGESIAEVLIALLIAALALTMLASVISTSAKIITNSKTAMNAYYEKRNALDAGTASTSEIKLQITKESSGVKLTVGQTTADYLPVNASKISDTFAANTPVVAYYKP